MASIRTRSGQFTTVDYSAPAVSPAFNQLLSQNDHYQAAGYYSNSLNNTTPDIPYTYDEVGGIFHVITIPGAVGGAQATGINNSGATFGFFIDGDGVNHGWILNTGVFMPLDYPGSTGTQALGLNNNGQVVGFYTDGRRRVARVRLLDRHGEVRDRRRSQRCRYHHRQRHQ